MSSKNKRMGYLLVISSPSGGGKTTIYNALLKIGDPFELSISATTRPPRPNEIDGVHYRFVADDVFDSMINNNEFAEWACVHGYRYGTPKVFIERAFNDNKIMILEIDVQGAMQIKKIYPNDAVLVFISPPSKEETEKRLTARQTNTPEDINRRLINAVNEIAEAVKFDYIVINDELEIAISDIAAIARAEYLSVSRFIGKLWENNN